MQEQNNINNLLAELNGSFATDESEVIVTKEIASSPLGNASDDITSNTSTPVEPDFIELEEASASSAKETSDSSASFTEQELDKLLQPKNHHSEYKPLIVESAFDLLCLLDPNIREGHIAAHAWQVETLDFLSQPNFTKDEPLEFLLCACNGSGKDAYVIAPFAVWHALCKVRSRTIITSSSYQQLQTQTEAYIRFLASRANSYCREIGIAQEDVFVIKKEHIVCSLTGSEIKMFATDDPGRAEGYHPFPDYPNSEMVIIVNEAKTVDDNIFKALRRCTGYNRWIEVSSPGTSEGHFYKSYLKAVHFPAPYEKGERYAKKITAYDCPHIKDIEIKRAFEELDLSFFRSVYLAEFTSSSADVIITPEQLEDCIRSSIDQEGDDEAGGLDLSLGGDETCLVKRKGNKAVSIDACKIRDAIQLGAHIDNKLTQRGFVKDVTPIYTDVGGLGLAVYAIIKNYGWKLIPVLNNAKANNAKLYSNRAAEDWFRVAGLVSKKQIVIPSNDPLLISQLGSRHYTRPNDDNNRVKLEPKPKAKAHGRPSPDRADAFILAFVNFESIGDRNSREGKTKEGNLALSARAVSQKTLVEAMSKYKFDLARYGGVNTSFTGAAKVQRRLLENNIEAYNKSRR